MQKNNIILTFLVLLQLNVFAQAQQSSKYDSSFKHIKQIAGKYSLVNVDALGNIYAITDNNKLKKISSSGDSLSVFNEVKKYGTASTIDVSNPLRVLLFYKNFSTVVVLDRQLAYRSNINFKQINIFKTKAITNAYDNNLWIFDEQDFKLKKINTVGKILSESTDTRQLFSEAPLPIKIIDYNYNVFLYDPQKGFFIFDYYGSVKQQIPFTNWTNITVENNFLYGVKGDSLYKYNIITQTQKSYLLPTIFKGYKNIFIQNTKLFLHKKEGIDIFEIQQ